MDELEKLKIKAEDLRQQIVHNLSDDDRYDFIRWFTRNLCRDCYRFLNSGEYCYCDGNIEY